MIERERERAQKILQILNEEFDLPDWAVSRSDVFPALIRTVLSQATNDRNRDRAYKNLSGKYEITPKGLAKAKGKDVEDAIRVGGLFRNKARMIIALSKDVLERFNGSLDFVYSEPLDKARSTLMSIPGVGPKTADVVLLFVAKKATVPVDTHVHRVSRRLELTPLNGDYEEIRSSLESLYAPKDYLAIHLLLISLGRKHCRARNPLHDSCPVRLLCPVPKREAKQPDLHKLHGSRDFP